jgi:hypothetical protein
MKEEKKEIRFLWDATPGWASLALGVVSLGLAWAKALAGPPTCIPIRWVLHGMAAQAERTEMIYGPDDKPMPRTPTPSEVWYSERAASAQRVNVVLLVLNVIGVVGYVVRASLSWAIPQRARVGFSHRRAVHQGYCRSAHPCCLSPVGSDLGSCDCRLPPMAERSLVVADGVDLARCNCARFRASLDSRQA